MGINVYTDASCTNEANQEIDIFAGDGVKTDFTLVNVAAANIEAVYIETRETLNLAFTSSNNKGTAAHSAPVNARVTHNGVFVGTVISSDISSMTLDRNYSGTTGITTISTFAPTTYTVSGNTIVLSPAPITGKFIYVIPTSTVSILCGGEQFQQIIKDTPFWVKSDSGFDYDSIQIYPQDRSITVISDYNYFTVPEMSFTTGVLTIVKQTDLSDVLGPVTVNGVLISDATNKAAIVSFVANCTNIKGLAINHGGLFRGMVQSITTSYSVSGSYKIYTYIITLDTSYTSSSSGVLEIFPIGSSFIAPSLIDGSIDTSNLKRVYDAPALTSNQLMKIWIRDIVTIGTAAINYPNQSIRISAIQFLSV